MRILHVGSGFRPLRRGGLVAYIEDLMDAQVERGDDVSYFFSGRIYPVLARPRLRRWQRRDVAMLEVVNSPLYDHGRQPELEISEPQLERMFRRVLDEVRPGVVHVQELAGLPFSLIDVAADAGIPVIVTLQDYFPVCSTFKLLDANGQVCTRREIGADCAATTAADPRPPGVIMDATIKFHFRTAPVVRSIRGPRVDRFIHRFSQRLVNASLDPSPPASGASFQRRRELNVERLNRADRVIAMSHRVADIYARLGVRPDRLTTIHLTLSHIERLTPRTGKRGGPVTFATLAGLESVPKGGRVLIEAMRQLAPRVEAGELRLVVFGFVDPDLQDAAAGVSGIDMRGRFQPSDLDAMLDEVDVGIVPSVWEEAYAYAGVEFLAKGIPVIANDIGGMPDYTRDGETGWLNRSCGADELARIMAGIADRPLQAAELSASVLARRDSIVKPVARHAEEMAALYGEAIEERAGAAA